ncbi:MAG: 16S rRNA (adenine(1518)-N(6)/adenine(1519)-N(6))-dimethyltransferase RsmA [Candidatus Thermoplasmatota archaeon]|nr:16S rRNA (adenine(1518)-N(6)/adenine(1519)-N(6))-dimethyltransferase RsmA [Candidatus Thermoplasmatota archaeon]
MSHPSRKGFTKKYGQVFLRNREIAAYEVDLLNKTHANVLEIGPGEGVLTGVLLERGYSVEAVEPDHRLSGLLMERFATQIKAGRLSVNPVSILDMKGISCDSIIGNIPYMISAPIVFKIFEFDFKEAVLMVQKEFAAKVCAKPGSRESGRITYSVQLRADVEYMRTVPRVFFDPVPDVDSAVIRIIPKYVDPEIALKKADELLRIIFSARRKKLGTVLKDVKIEYASLRGEELSMEMFIDLCKNYQKND